MPINPQCQSILDMMAQMKVPDFSVMSPGDARRVFAGFPRPEHPTPVAQVEERTIPGPGAEGLRLRIYTPESAAPKGALLYLHGGGWVMGDLDIYDEISRTLASQSGLVIITLAFRLAPETPYPGALEDCYAALSWIADEAASLGVDPERVGLIGDSSGGNLAAALSLMTRDRSGPKVALQVLICPITDHQMDTPSYREFAEGCFLTRTSMQWFWDHYLPDLAQRSEPHASPLRAADHSGLPPTFVITAEYDPVRDEGEAYARALEEAGVKTKLVRYEGVVHGFIGFSAMVERSREMLRAVAEHASEHLG